MAMDAAGQQRRLERFLDARRRHMPAPAPAAVGVHALDMRGEQELPARRPWRRRILARQPMRHRRMPAPGEQVAPMQRDPAQRQLLQRRGQARRQHRHPVLCTLSRAHHDRARTEVEVLHAQRHAFADAHPAAVQQGRDQSRQAAHRVQCRTHLVRRQHLRQALRAAHPAPAFQQTRAGPAEHLPMQEQQRVDRLQVRTGRHLAPLHQVVEEAAGRGLVPRRAPPQPEEALVARHPMHVGRFGIAAQLPRPACPAHARHRVLAINARFQTPSSHHLHLAGKYRKPSAG